MERDFDAAIKEWELADKQWLQYDTIQFALKFTKAALSGEVSDGMQRKGDQAYSRKLNDILSPTPTEDLNIGASGYCFTAMCQQLAKEVGHG